MTLVGNLVPRTVGNVALPGRHASAIDLVTNRLRACASKGPLIRVQSWRVIVGPLLGRVQLIVVNRLVTRGVLRGK